MAGAHTPPGEYRVRERGRGRLPERAERAVTLIELLIVMIIIAIVTAMVLPSVRSARQAPDGPGIEVAASSLWRAFGRHRSDHRGLLPASAPIVAASNAATTNHASNQIATVLRSPSGEPYLLRFPSLPGNSSRPIQVRTAPAGATGTPYLVYVVAGQVGRLEGYDSGGRMRWCRSVQQVTGAQFQNGGGGRITC
jgi:prepilin-type N-terminal cleavage/methylation domain-containing protein